MTPTVGGSGTGATAPGGSPIARVAIGLALLVAVVLVAVVLFGGGGDYAVKARFINAGQLVKGNYVEVGGTKAGEVTGFRITPDGMAEVDITIDDRYAPLRSGTRAIIRAGSLSSTSNRYIELFLPGEHEAGEEIPDGGLIDVDSTTANVEFDQLFDIFDRPTRRALQDFYEGGYRAYAGQGEKANRGFRYLNPQLAASSRLFEELSSEPAVLERFLVDSSRLVTTLASRRDDLAPLVQHLNQTTRALSDEKAALAEAVELLPPFLRRANSTYVNLRATLDDLDPFVEASKPVARKLRPYLAELRPFAREAVPTVRDLRTLVRRRGDGNDLIEFNRTYPPLADIALATKERSIDFGTGAVDVGNTRGAFPELQDALEASTPVVAHGRPYTPDFVGWMDDFSHTGAFDALGSFSRAQLYFNAYSFGETGLNFIPLDQRGSALKNLTRTGQLKRCPGAAEEPAADGSNLFTEEERKELDCVEEHRATGNLP